MARFQSLNNRSVVDEALMKNYVPKEETAEEKAARSTWVDDHMREYYEKNLPQWNKYGSAWDYEVTDEGKRSRLQDTIYKADGKFDIDKYRAYKDQVGDTLSAGREISAFEEGELAWVGLSQGVKDFYLANFDPHQIVAEIDQDTGQAITVADIMPTPPPK